MPARRPYASRGVPRRPTLRRSGARSRTAPLLIGAGVLVVLVAGWALIPFATAARLSGAGAAVSQSDPNGAEPETTPAAQLADVALPTAVSRQAATAQPTLAPLLRAWDTITVDGIIPAP